MLTACQLLELPPLSEGKLVAGATGVEHEVLWAAVVDIPQAMEWVRSSELLLTTFYGIRDDVDAQVALCEQLADKQLAGMIVAAGKYVDHVSDPVRAAADHARFPIIELPSLIAAFLTTVICSIIGIVLALLLGILAGFGRLSNLTVIRSISSVYVETVRGTPLLFQLLVWFFGIQIVLVTLFNINVDILIYNLLTALNSNSLFPKTGVSGIVFAVIALSFNYGAYLAEVVRAGIQAVEPGQTEAAQSLGLGGFQTARFVVLPQALRIMIPPLTNNFITLIQDTSFFQVLGVAELSLVIQTAVQSTSSSPTLRGALYAFELAVYFVICYSLATVSRIAERRVAHTIAGAH